MQETSDPPPSSPPLPPPPPSSFLLPAPFPPSSLLLPSSLLPPSSLFPPPASSILPPIPSFPPPPNSSSVSPAPPTSLPPTHPLPPSSLSAPPPPPPADSNKTPSKLFNFNPPPVPANVLLEKEKWLTLESNEIYVIRNENLSKTNEWIYYKLQREKLLSKRSNPYLDKIDEDRLKQESLSFKQGFSFAREVFATATKTKKIIQKKQEKMKRTVDSLTKEAKTGSYSQLKDLEIAKFYMYEMAKENLRKRPKVEEGEVNRRTEENK